MRRLALFLLLVNAAVEAQYGYGPYDEPTTKAVATTGGNSSPTSTGAASSAGGGDADGDAYGAGGEYGGYKISPRGAVVAHAACGALATMLILPVGVMAARAPRGFTGKRWWFPLHAGIQGVLGLGLVLAAFGIAWSKFSRHPVDTPHRKAAVSLFSLVIAQVFLGMFVHFVRSRSPKLRWYGRGISNYAHWILGSFVIGVGWATAWLGLTTEWEYRGHGKPAFGWRVGWGVVVALWILLYAAGLMLLPRQLRRERDERRAIDGHDDGLIRGTPTKQTTGLVRETHSRQSY